MDCEQNWLDSSSLTCDEFAPSFFEVYVIPDQRQAFTHVNAGLVSIARSSRNAEARNNPQFSSSSAPIRTQHANIYEVTRLPVPFDHI